MKYLKNNIILLIVLICGLYADDCFESWVESNFINNQKLFQIIGLINNSDQIKIYIDKYEKIKIDYLDKIIISDSDKISNFSKTTNQLIIENADSILNNFIFSFFDYNKLNLYLNKIKPNHYFIKNINSDTEVIFTDSCRAIQSLEINIDRNNIYVSRSMIL